MALFCVFTPLFLHVKRNQLKDADFNSKFGSLVQDLRKDNSFGVRFYFSMFMLRRLLFASLILYMVDRPWAQVQALSFMCTVQVIFIGFYSPFILRWMNRLETSNEFLVLIGTYYLFVYSDGFLNKEDSRLSDVHVKDWEMQE